MALNPANFIAELVATDPPLDDPASQADDHMRAIKKAIKQTFPGTFDAALTLTPTLAQGLEARIAALEALPAPAETFAPVMDSIPIFGTGTEAITGVGFEPSLVLMVIVRDDSGHAGICIGAASAANEATGKCLYAESDGTDQRSQVDDFLWSVAEGTPLAVISRGILTSFDADGFTIDKVINVGTVSAIWVAFQ